MAINKVRDSASEADSVYAAGESVLVRLAVRLYKLRTTKKLTQSELAERTGVDQANISDIENGDANPTARTIGRLAAGLGVNAAALLDHASMGVQFGSNLSLHEGVEWRGRRTVVSASAGSRRKLPGGVRVVSKLEIETSDDEILNVSNEKVGAV